MIEQKWTVDQALDDVDAYAEWLAATPDDESDRIHEEIVAAWHNDLAKLPEDEAAAWQEWMDASLEADIVEGPDGYFYVLEMTADLEPEDDPDPGEPLELPLPLAASEPDARGPPLDANRPPRGTGNVPGQAADRNQKQVANPENTVVRLRTQASTRRAWLRALYAAVRHVERHIGDLTRIRLAILHELVGGAS
jgi:hypothetical protein